MSPYPPAGVGCLNLWSPLGAPTTPPNQYAMLINHLAGASGLDFAQPPRSPYYSFKPKSDYPCNPPAGAGGLDFAQPPRSPYYSYLSGRASPYGEQTLALLMSLAEAGGFDCRHYAELKAAVFGPGFDGYRCNGVAGCLVGALCLSPCSRGRHSLAGT